MKGRHTCVCVYCPPDRGVSMDGSSRQEGAVGCGLGTKGRPVCWEVRTVNKWGEVGRKE